MTSSWVLLLLLLPVTASLLWARTVWHRDISWKETGYGLLLVTASASVCLVVSRYFFLQDTETRSGAAISAQLIPEWKSNETSTETTTDSKGRTHTRTRHYVQTHPEEVWVYSEIGTVATDRGGWNAMARTHGKYVRAVEGSRPNYRSGDENDYHMDLTPDGNPAYPVHKSFTWSNYIEQSDSIQKLPYLPEREAKQLKLPQYPPVSNPFCSSRLIGMTGFSTYRWDQMNARLGPSKHVNLIAVAFGKDSTAEKAVALRSYWRNGKKNDLVICYDKPDHPSWAYVFGWAKHASVKVSLQNLIAGTNYVDDEIILAMEQTVREEFSPYPWKEHVDDGPPVSTGCFWVTTLVTCLVTAGYLYLVKNN